VQSLARIYMYELYVRLKAKVHGTHGKRYYLNGVERTHIARHAHNATRHNTVQAGVYYAMQRQTNAGQQPSWRDLSSPTKQSACDLCW
jgi:hypothetical protein